MADKEKNQERESQKVAQENRKSEDQKQKGPVLAKPVHPAGQDRPGNKPGVNSDNDGPLHNGDTAG
ncbi:hypothetical protein [Tengunoibacter tsumagoiensis]|uniref:Uncharacterized protein n=1 Tax=Tengunoibacter tsumagoiensis TaxID=2014871 RepID=A0A402A6M8_9CHLR|nr:hypothetical protein [Tengunoibacter tsumagoiensis]GCE14778.1 hypothetical protein KTT_46370 [Tengunoibacter tsumagoiensis]